MSWDVSIYISFSHALILSHHYRQTARLTYFITSTQQPPPQLTMLFQKFAIVATLIALVAAQEIERNDIPQQCTQVCAQVLDIARDCDNRFGM